MKIHQKNSKLESLSLSSIYKYISRGDTLMGVPDSMVDVRAQYDLVLHKYFVPFLDCTNTFCSVDNIFSKNKLSTLKRDL